MKQRYAALITTVLAMINNFCLAPLNVLRPVYVKETLGAGAGGLSVLGTALLIGMICAGYGLDVTGRALKEHLDHVRIYPARNRLFCVRDPRTSAGMAGGVCAFCMFITGFAVSMLTAPISTYLMEVTPRHMLGRIGALMTVACTAAIPVGSLITGFVAEHYPPILFSIMGFIMMSPVIFLIRKKSFRAI